MRRIQKFAAINILAVLIGAGIPAMAAQDGYEGYNRGGIEHQTAGHRGDGDWRDNRNRNFRDDRRSDLDRRDYARGYREDRSYRDDRRYRDNRGYGYGYNYGPGPVYETAPVYVAPSYQDGYYYDRDHYGRRRVEPCR